MIFYKSTFAEFDGDDLLAQAASFFVAGFEPASTTATFALYELAVLPEMQDRLRKEVLEALDKNDGKITYDMVLGIFLYLRCATNFNIQKISHERIIFDDIVCQRLFFFSLETHLFQSRTTYLNLFEIVVSARDFYPQNRIQTSHFNFSQAMSLPYLDMVVSETLRLYPTLGYLNRMPNDTYKVPNSDLVLEKGTPVYVSMLGMHLDPQYFPEPHKFDPERFNEENKRNIPPCVYFPFGEGPHTCIGK